MEDSTQPATTTEEGIERTTTVDTESNPARDNDNPPTPDTQCVPQAMEGVPQPSTRHQDVTAESSQSQQTSGGNNVQPTSRRTPRILGSCPYCAEYWVVVYSRPQGRAVTNNKDVCKDKLHVMCDMCFVTHISQAVRENKPATCPICRAEIKELFDVTPQMEEAYPPETGKGRNRKQTTKDIATGRVQPDALTCSCGATFTNRGSLSRHRKRHLATRPHICQLCCKDFPDKWGLDRHKKQVHK